MPQLPTIGQQNWGTPLNNFLQTAHDNTPTNGGKVKPDGILPGSVGQVLTTGANGPAWASANSLLPTTVFPYNLPGEMVYRTVEYGTNNLYTVPNNKVLWLLQSQASSDGAGGTIGFVLNPDLTTYAEVGQANPGNSANNSIFNPPLFVPAGKIIRVFSQISYTRFSFQGWLVDA